MSTTAITTMTTATTMGTSNLRGSSNAATVGSHRQTRANPSRAHKGVKIASSVLRRQNPLATTTNHNGSANNGGTALALASSSSAAVAGTTNMIEPIMTIEPPGMYPAISHFADAIVALPREYRRHNSLLKEVDAKAWAAEENLQSVLEQCLAHTQAMYLDLALTAQRLAETSTDDDPGHASEIQSLAGASVEDVSLASGSSADPAVVQRRRQFQALRQNLIANMVTMDEKNHVINNANEEMAKQIRRLDRIWPHIADELSEEARVGSLKHWALTDINPARRPAAPATGRDVPSNNPHTTHDSEIAHRSEARREALLARRQRAVAHVDSDLDDSRPSSRKPPVPNGKRRPAETGPDPAGLGISGTGAGAGAGVGRKRKPEKLTIVGGVGMERSLSSAPGGRPMSRENSQADNLKKRKASTAATTVARKRINASALDSPKLASSPLAGSAGKEAYKRSPALSSVRPATGRGRQNSTQNADSVRGRQLSAASHKNGTNVQTLNASTPELNKLAALTGKTTNEVQTTMKATETEKGDRLVEGDESVAVNGTANGADHQQFRGALLLSRSRSTSKHEVEAKGEPVAADVGAAKGVVASPRLPLAALQTSEIRSERRGRASKTSTPVASTFAEAAEEGDSAASTNGNGTGGSKNTKRPSRPRMKDHGLHDSLSPKGLPMKRSHKKGGSLGVSTFGPVLPGGGGAPPQRRGKDDETDPATATHSNTPSERGGSGGGGGAAGNANKNSNSSNDNAAAAVAAVEVDPAVEADVDDGNDGGDEDEERYCYCQGVSYGEMVACDKADCPRQWFHLECIGLKSVPKSAKWYCDECKDVLAKKAGKLGGGNGSNAGNGDHVGDRGSGGNPGNGGNGDNGGSSNDK